MAIELILSKEASILPFLLPLCICSSAIYNPCPLALRILAMIQLKVIDIASKIEDLPEPFAPIITVSCSSNVRLAFLKPLKLTRLLL